MPKATVSQNTVRKNLDTCPGGYVELRQLSYYEMMHRRDLVSKMYAEVQQETKKAPRDRQRKGASAEEDARMFFELMNVSVMEFEFGNCIVSHNLEDDNGNLLDFSNPMSFHILDPKVGAEIGRYIDELNQEDEEDLDPSITPATSSSLDGETRPERSTEIES